MSAQNPGGKTPEELQELQNKAKAEAAQMRTSNAQPSIEARRAFFEAVLSKRSQQSEKPSPIAQVPAASVSPAIAPVTVDTVDGVSPLVAEQAQEDPAQIVGAGVILNSASHFATASPFLSADTISPNGKSDVQIPVVTGTAPSVSMDPMNASSRAGVNSEGSRGSLDSASTAPSDKKEEWKPNVTHGSTTLKAKSAPATTLSARILGATPQPKPTTSTVKSSSDKKEEEKPNATQVQKKDQDSRSENIWKDFIALLFNALFKAPQAVGQAVGIPIGIGKGLISIAGKVINKIKGHAPVAPKSEAAPPVPPRPATAAVNASAGDQAKKLKDSGKALESQSKQNSSDGPKMTPKFDEVVIKAGKLAVQEAKALNEQRSTAQQEERKKAELVGNASNSPSPRPNKPGG